MEYQTIDGHVISEEIYKQIKEICPELTLKEILRLVDLFKANMINI